MYFSDQKVFEEEIKPGLDEGKGCVVLDLVCRFPYSNQEVLTFGFNIDSDIIKDYKINHRFPNKSYVTVSKILDDSTLSKCGYPCFIEIPEDSETNVLMLNIGVGINGEVMNIILPVNVAITKDKPVCALGVAIDFDTMHLDMRTYAMNEDGGYTEFRVTNYELENVDPERYVLLNNATKVAENCVAFSDAVAPIPCTLAELAV